MTINGYFLKVTTKLKDIKGITYDVLKTLPLIELKRKDNSFFIAKGVFKKKGNRRVF